jgi:hypothetical protein
MKKLLKILIALIILPGFVFSQSVKTEKLFEKYAEKEGFYYLKLETNLLSSKDEFPDDGIVYLQMLTFKQVESSAKEVSKVYKEFQNVFNSQDYTGLIDVNSKGEKMDMMVKKSDGKVSEIVVIILDKTETMLISATGNFDLKKLANFDSVEKCKRLSILQKLCEE